MDSNTKSLQEKSNFYNDHKNYIHSIFYLICIFYISVLAYEIVSNFLFKKKLLKKENPYKSNTLTHELVEKHKEKFFETQTKSSTVYLKALIGTFFNYISNFIVLLIIFNKKVQNWFLEFLSKRVKEASKGSFLEEESEYYFVKFLILYLIFNKFFRFVGLIFEKRRFLVIVLVNFLVLSLLIYVDLRTFVYYYYLVFEYSPILIFSLLFFVYNLFTSIQLLIIFFMSKYQANIDTSAFPDDTKEILKENKLENKVFYLNTGDQNAQGCVGLGYNKGKKIIIIGNHMMRDKKKLIPFIYYSIAMIHTDFYMKNIILNLLINLLNFFVLLIYYFLLVPIFQTEKFTKITAFLMLFIANKFTVEDIIYAFLKHFVRSALSKANDFVKKYNKNKDLGGSIFELYLKSGVYLGISSLSDTVMHDLSSGPRQIDYLKN